MNHKVAYLTIDDAPSKDFRKKVDFLIKKNIPAMFFCRGDFIGKREKDDICAIKNGFVIGNHSYNHPEFSKLSLAEAFAQIKKTDDVIEKLYLKAEIKRPAKLFRYPYGDKGGSNYQKIQQYLKQSGYLQPKFKDVNYGWFNSLKKDIDIYWTFDIKEWCLNSNVDPKIKSIDDIFNRMQQKEHQHGGSLLDNNSADIILIHDHQETTDEFYKITEKLLKMDIKFKSPKFL